LPEWLVDIEIYRLCLGIPMVDHNPIDLLPLIVLSPSENDQPLSENSRPSTLNDPPLTSIALSWSESDRPLTSILLAFCGGDRALAVGHP
jgi:hypothetical protein